MCLPLRDFFKHNILRTFPENKTTQVTQLLIA